MLEYPSKINIELTSRCNKICPNCPQDKSRGDMDLGLLENILKQLPEEVEITFHKDGEPLLYKYLYEALMFSYDNFTHFCTNGLLLNEKAEDIIDNVNLITISVIEDDKEQEKEIIEFLKLPRKETGINIKTFSDDMYKKWLKLHDNVFISKKHYWTNPPKEFFNKKQPINICSELEKKISINYDGTVSCCCLDYKHQCIIGDTKIQTIKKIWNGQKLKNLKNLIREGRKDETEICKKCSILYKEK